MRGASPVSIELRRSGGWRGAVLLFAVAVLGVVIDWAWRSAQPGWGGLLGAIVLACSVHLLRMPRGRLRWDGRQWWCGDDAGTIDAQLDLGRWMLLRFRGRRVAWLPVSSADAGADWNALRTAVYSPPQAPTELSTADVPPTRDV